MYRGLQPQDRAYITALADMQTRLTQVEKRIRWSGHTVQRTLPGPTSIVVNPIAIWGAPPWDPGATWTPLLTVPMDPGGWLLVGSAAVGGNEDSGSAFVWSPFLRVRAGALTATGKAREEILAPSPGSQMRYHLSATLPIDSPDPFTVVVEAQVAGATFDAANAYLARLVAVPS